MENLKNRRVKQATVKQKSDINASKKMLWRPMFPLKGIEDTTFRVTAQNRHYSPLKKKYEKKTENRKLKISKQA